LFRKEDLLKDHLRERFYVTPKDGSQPFSGVLVHVAKRNYEFADIKANNQAADGPLFIDRNNVSYIQYDGGGER